MARSALLDYRYFIVNKLLFALLFVPALAVIGPVVMEATVGVLREMAPGLQDLASNSTLIVALGTVTALLVADFGTFLVHYLQHRVPVLWEFHKVHHSATVLTPMTVYRMHPVDDVLALAATACGVSVVSGVFTFVIIGEVGVWSVFGLNVFVYAFYLLGYNLRHSHIWISYGPLLSQVLISPAQHQIHHSRELRHHNRNFGLMFAFWDRIFGSLYVPTHREDLEYGLRSSENERYSSIRDLLCVPFKRLFRQHQAQAVVSGSAITMVLVALAVVSASVVASEAPQDSVRLEELTWVEVRERISSGARTVVVPTAGNEQNGPHVVLGKHHYIVEYTSNRIARELGDALVAPVVTYVPEGEIFPPRGHMRYSGTLSLPPEVFEQVLESTARSLRTHGFELICFLGDSGASQKSQERVAARLNEEWVDETTRVINVGSYYSSNGQLEWLTGLGIPVEEIGTHAGIRDTSELLFVRPDGVRTGKLMVGSHNSAQGVSGDPTRATAEMGRKMVDLKVKAAVSEIRSRAHPDALDAP